MENRNKRQLLNLKLKIMKGTGRHYIIKVRYFELRNN